MQKSRSRCFVFSFERHHCSRVYIRIVLHSIRILGAARGGRSDRDASAALAVSNALWIGNAAFTIGRISRAIVRVRGLSVISSFFPDERGGALARRREELVSLSLAKSIVDPESRRSERKGAITDDRDRPRAGPVRKRVIYNAAHCQAFHARRRRASCRPAGRVPLDDDETISSNPLRRENISEDSDRLPHVCTLFDHLFVPISLSYSTRLSRRPSCPSSGIDNQLCC